MSSQADEGSRSSIQLARPVAFPQPAHISSRHNARCGQIWLDPTAYHGPARGPKLNKQPPGNGSISNEFSSSYSSHSSSGTGSRLIARATGCGSGATGAGGGIGAV